MKKDEIQLLFYKSRGPGGQRKNRKQTAVKAVHLPTGLTARATEYRSQAKNRQLALERLEAKVQRLKQPVKKRIPTRKPLFVRQKEIREKKIHSEKKSLRKTVVIE